MSCTPTDPCAERRKYHRVLLRDENDRVTELYSTRAGRPDAEQALRVARIAVRAAAAVAGITPPAVYIF